MSVVIGTSEQPRYRIECSDDADGTPGIWATAKQAEQAMGEHYASSTGVLCAEWRSAAPFQVRTSPTLKVSRRNGAMLLDALGWVLIARAVAPVDADQPGTVLREGWTDRGRRSGYPRDQSHRLHEIAKRAVLHDELIVWA